MSESDGPKAPIKAPINAPPIGDARLAPRSEAFQRFMAAPLLVATALVVATGTLLLLVWIGTDAAGERVSITLSGTCTEEAAPFIAARAEEIGLGDVQLDTATPGALQVSAVLPGLQDDEQAHVPELLARRGRLVVGPPDAPIVTEADLDFAMLRLDEQGMPYTWLAFEEAPLERLTAAVNSTPEGTIALSVDHIQAPERPNSRKVEEGGIRLLPGDGNTRTRMQAAADHTIVLTHGPLPCALTVDAVTTAASADDVAGGQPAK